MTAKIDCEMFFARIRQASPAFALTTRLQELSGLLVSNNDTIERQQLRQQQQQQQ